MAILSDRVRRARRLAGLSQSQLAAQLSVARSAVTHWERLGGSTPTTHNLCGIVEVTGVTFEWLTAGRGPITATGAWEPSGVPASALAMDDAELALLGAFRTLRPAARGTLLSLLRELGHQGGRSRRSSVTRSVT